MFKSGIEYWQHPIFIIGFSILFHFQVLGSDNSDSTRLFFSYILDEEMYYETRIFREKEDDTIVNLIVLLDGDEYMGIASDFIDLYNFDQRFDNTCILALHSTTQSRFSHYTPSQQDWTNNDDKEQIALYSTTGRFPLFSEFLSKEIIPFLEERFNIHFRNKSIFGHSMGGLCVLSFLVYSPELFDNYISISPSVVWDDYVLLREMETLASNKQHIYNFKSFHLGIAEKDIAHYISDVKYVKKFIEKDKSSGADFNYFKLKDETHMTSGVQGLIRYLNMKVSAH